MFDRLPGLALELAALKPRVIVASAAASTAVHKVAPELPMVFCSYAADPIKAGFAQSYVRPGGNTTGNVMNAVGGEEALTQKRMGLFKELVPGLKRLGFIGTATSILAVAELNALRKRRRSLRLRDRTPPDPGARRHRTRRCVEQGRRRGSARCLGRAAVVQQYGARAAVCHGVGKTNASAPIPRWGQAELLMSYSADLLDDFRRAGIYAAKILGGDKPGELPIEQASKFVLVVNVKTARQLGVGVPPTLLALADIVVE